MPITDSKGFEWTPMQTDSGADDTVTYMWVSQAYPFHEVHHLIDPSCVIVDAVASHLGEYDNRFYSEHEPDSNLDAIEIEAIVKSVIDDWTKPFTPYYEDEVE